MFTTLVFAAGAGGIWSAATASDPSPPALGDMVVIAYNDLGMHCMNEDFSEICILPPYNTMRATVIDRRNEDPRILTTGITLEYSVPGNTVSHTKTNFWDFTQGLFGVQLPPNIGLTGNGMTGTMSPAPERDWIVTGIPVTPLTDTGLLDPFQLAEITVKQNGVIKDVTKAVIPVSWEIRCDMCHIPKNGVSVAMDILQKHDRKHGTDLVHKTPVLCASCHADPALGTTGVPGVPTMSSAMHMSHSKRPFLAPPKPSTQAIINPCYNCHPGNQTQCLRDVHYAKGMNCVSCHGNMKAVGDPARRPWQDEPKCGSCHHVAGHEYEQPGKLYRDSVGHSGVKCVVCHNSPHAVVPTVTPRDNEQMVRVQGHPGTLNTCSVCHRQAPEEPFFHRRSD